MDNGDQLGINYFASLNNTMLYEVAKYLFEEGNPFAQVMLKMSVENKRAFIRKCVSKVEWDGETRTVSIEK